MGLLGPLGIVSGDGLPGSDRESLLTWALYKASGHDGEQPATGTRTPDPSLLQ